MRDCCPLEQAMQQDASMHAQGMQELTAAAK